MIFIILLFCGCSEKKTEIFKMYTHPQKENRGDPKRKSESFIVSNPPEDLGHIILFYQREIKRLSSVENKKKLKGMDFYCQMYFKERFLLDRNYIPLIPDDGGVYYANSLFDRLFTSKIVEDDIFINITFKDNVEEDYAPIPPYLYIQKWNLYYFPKGLKNNPDIHWKMYRKSERGSYYDEQLQF